MSSVYTLDNDKTLFIYTINNTIVLRTCNSESMSRPVILATDYIQGMTDTIYNNTLYYCYQNSSNDIIIKNITETSQLYKISSQDLPDCHEPHIISFHNSLLLIYFVKNILDDTYFLKCILPFESNKTLNIHYSSKELPKPNIISYTDMLMINLTPDYTLHIDSAFNISEDNQNTILEQNEVLSIENDSLRATVTRLQKETEEKSAIIESIKSQYNQLMDTAVKCRDEAIKWRSKFTSSKYPMYEQQLQSNPASHKLQDDT